MLAAQQPAVSDSGPGVIRVRVVDPETSAPISGIEVRLRGPSAAGVAGLAIARQQGAPTQERTLLTDAAGVAAFEHLAPGSYSFEAQSDGYRGVNPSSFPAFMAPALA